MTKTEHIIRCIFAGAGRRELYEYAMITGGFLQQMIELNIIQSSL